MPVHPVKVQAQKDIETFKRLLAELKAGRRGGVMEGVWLDEPAEYIDLIERTICKLSKCSKSAEAAGTTGLSREQNARHNR